MQEEVDKVLQRAHWDEEAELWALDRLSDTQPSTALLPADSGAAQQQQHKLQQQPFGVMPSSSRPYAVRSTRRPMCAFTKAALASGDMNPRFRWAMLSHVLDAREIVALAAGSCVDRLLKRFRRPLEHASAMHVHTHIDMLLSLLQSFMLLLLLPVVVVLLLLQE